MSSITLKGREIPLLMTTLELKTIQQEICPAGEFIFMLYGRKPDDGDQASMYMTPEHLDTVVKAVRILGNAALDDAGLEPDLTDKWIARALKPGMLPKAATACMEAFNDGMESEIPPKTDGEPVDVTLQELNKKKEPES